MPGPTDTAIFDRSGMDQTEVGRSDKDDPADVAAEAVDALLAGKDHVVPGPLENKAMATVGKLLPGAWAARLHATRSEPDR
jgi:short-subunit dehydrogenase